jgi:hypothetical protein
MVLKVVFVSATMSGSGRREGFKSHLCFCDDVGLRKVENGFKSRLCFYDDVGLR